jgi:hypothetical protein
MNINSSEFARFLDNILQVKFNEMFEKKIIQEGYVKSWTAKVVNVGVGTADVVLPGDAVNVITNLKNKTGVALNINDEVYLFSPYSVLTSAYIAVKKS